VQLTRHYSLTVLDPGAAGLMRLLKIAGQLVIVVPASIDGAGALADTRDWLDTHGFAELADHSVTVINGVSRQPGRRRARRVGGARPLPRNRPGALGRHAACRDRGSVRASPADPRRLYRARGSPGGRHGRRASTDKPMTDKTEMR
jgi:hypothetical protein